MTDVLCSAPKTLVWNGETVEGIYFGKKKPLAYYLPYTVLHIPKVPNSREYRLIVQRMSNFVILLSANIDVGPFELLFRSVLVLKTCFELLVGEIEDAQKKLHVVDAEKAGCQKLSVFGVKANMLHYTSTIGISFSSMQVKRVKKISNV